MTDHDDPMLCPDRHREVEIALKLAEIPDIVGVLDPHAGTSHLMVPRELLVDCLDALVRDTVDRKSLVDRLAGVNA